MKLKCALIDDEPLALDLLESYVRKTPFLSLEGRYSSAVQALDKLLEAPVDLLFLDIQMPGLDGMEFSKMIKDRCRIPSHTGTFLKHPKRHSNGSPA